MRTPREVLFGEYHTHADGLWTLTKLELAAAQYKQNMVEVPGRSAPLDLSTSLTDGEPTYSTRNLVVTLESSEGSRLAREARISQMTNALDGYRLNIVLPDDAEHYLSGRVHVERLYNDEAHASVRVTAVCDPWRYAKDETVVVLEATEAEQTAVLTNQGRLGVVPLLVVTEGDVLITFGAFSWALGAGSYALPDLYLKYGEHPVKFSGSGVLTLTYREAIL